MTNSFAGRLSVLALAVLAVGAFAETAAAANKARVELLSSTATVRAGQPFEIALEFDIDDHWHIYWQNAGDSGLPPNVTWRLPDGFQIADLRFPIPKRLEQSGLATNILEGNPVLLATVTPPESIASANVTLTANLKWLVCATQCLREDQSVSLSLPVAAVADPNRPANEKLFKRARRMLPVPAGKARYVTVTPSLGSGSLGPDAKFEIHLDVTIKPGIHIQSNKPLQPGLLPTEVFMGPQDALFFDPALFPKAKVRSVSGIGKLSEFAGAIKIRIPAEADTELPADKLTISGIFVYQACNEKGTCYPKEGVEWSFDVPIGQAAAAPPVVADPPAVQAATKPVDDVVAPAAPETEAGIASDGDALTAFLAGLGLPGLLLGCFIYGLALNATPCVLPLLSIKVMGFVQQAHESRRRTLALGLSFGAGVIIFFVALGFLAAAGKNVLQYPVAVIILGAVVLALSLSMLGVYTLQVPNTATKLDASIQKEGVLSSFGKGALAPVLGFACTGPLLAAGFGWATQQPPRIAIFAFLASGLGMASPYMLLGANPNWLGFLPKPGNWMITFERIMGFLLLAMVIWLIHPLVTHLGAEGLEWTMAFFVAVGMGCWILGKINYTMSAETRWRYRGTAVGVVAAAGFLIYGWAFPLGAAQDRQMQLDNTVAGGSVADDEIPWRHWSNEAVAETVRSGKTVFVDFTAAYCTVCKVNKKVAINTPEFLAKLRELNVVAFKGDFTSGDPAIFEVLQKHSRAGVPLNLIYPASQPDRPIVLPPNITLDLVLSKLSAAGPSTDVLASAPTP